MFHKEDHRRRGSFGLFTIFRLILSVVILGILGLGSYRAFVYFSGTDPTTADPKAALATLITSEQVAGSVKSLLGVDLPVDFIEKNVLSVSTEDGLPMPPEDKTVPNPNRTLVLRFALVADSHNDNQNLQKSLTKAKELDAKFVIGLGDYSDVGTIDELSKAKSEFERSGLPYYVTAGDHDLWDGRDKGLPAVSRFTEVFGPPYQSFGDSGIRFIIVYNSDNYQGVDPLQFNWLETELQRVRSENPKQIFAFIHEPLYHPSSDHMMGKENQNLRQQADRLTSLFKDAGIAEVFAGDTHFSTRYIDPKSGVSMSVVGATSKARNAQAPRFSVVDVFDDGSYNVEDIEIGD